MNKAYHSKSTEADNSQTPLWVIRQIQAVANISIVHDVCATEISSKAGACYWSKEDDALSLDWAAEFSLNSCAPQLLAPNDALWQNPPFSLAAEFTTKAADEALKGVVTIGCVKHAPDSDWFIKMEKRATFIYVPDGRIQFLKANGEPFVRQEMKQGIPTGRNIPSGANFPVCFPLWTPFTNNGRAEFVRFKRDMEKYSES